MSSPARSHALKVAVAADIHPAVQRWWGLYRDHNYEAAKEAFKLALPDPQVGMLLQLPSIADATRYLLNVPLTMERSIRARWEMRGHPRLDEPLPRSSESGPIQQQQSSTDSQQSVGVQQQRQLLSQSSHRPPTQATAPISQSTVPQASWPGQHQSFHRTPTLSHGSNLYSHLAPGNPQTQLSHTQQHPYSQSQQAHAPTLNPPAAASGAQLHNAPRPPMYAAPETVRPGAPAPQPEPRHRDIQQSHALRTPEQREINPPLPPVSQGQRSYMAAGRVEGAGERGAQPPPTPRSRKEIHASHMRVFKRCTEGFVAEAKSARSKWRHAEETANATANWLEENVVAARGRYNDLHDQIYGTYQALEVELNKLNKDIDRSAKAAKRQIHTADPRAPVLDAFTGQREAVAKQKERRQLIERMELAQPSDMQLRQVEAADEALRKAETERDTYATVTRPMTIQPLIDRITRLDQLVEEYNKLYGWDADYYHANAQNISDEFKLALQQDN